MAISLGKKVNAKKLISRKKVFCTKKFFPLVYLVNHVEINHEDQIFFSFSKHIKCSANVFNFSLSSFSFDFRASISSIEFRSKQKSSNFFFHLDLGRVCEFSSDPSQRAILCLVSTLIATFYTSFFKSTVL